MISVSYGQYIFKDSSFFKKMSHPRHPFLQKKCEKCPSSIWGWDSNPQPLEHESPPVTARPG